MAHRTFEGERTSSWLAMSSFGCCASRRDSFDGGRAELRAKGETEMTICYEQPQVVAQPRAESMYARPTTSHSMGRHVSQWVSNGKDFATRASSRASVYTLNRPRKSMSRARPSIGRPTDFRHNEGFDGVDGIQSMIDDAPMPVRRRRSFRPLELSIYLPDGRLSPLPDFTNPEWELPQMPAQAIVNDRNSVASMSTTSFTIQRKPVGAGSRRSSINSQTSLHSRPLSAALSTLPFLQEESKSRPESVLSDRPAIQRSSTHSSLVSPRILSRLPSPSRSRSNTTGSRPGSLRRAKTDVDEAIRELNTIVEERRADAYRSNTQSPALINRVPPSPSHHVPAIAPSLRMHVRSETLSDIGSAFSVPLSGKPLPNPPTSHPVSSHTRTNTKISVSTTLSRTLTGPLNSNPITPESPTIPTPTTPIQKLGAWLKRSIPNTPPSPSLKFRSGPTTPKSSHSNTPFYNCEPMPSHPAASSRPSTAGSRTLAHARQDSNDTATVTLFTSSYPTTPALSTRSLSPEPEATSPPTPARINLLKGEGKARGRPAPLDLAKEKEMQVEVALASAKTTRSLKPPVSPNYGLLPGMEMTSGQAGFRDSLTPVSPVGVAF